MRPLRALSIVTILAAAACAGSDILPPSPTPPIDATDVPVNPPAPVVAPIIFKATIHGVRWVATDSVVVTRKDGYVEISSAGPHAGEPMTVSLRIADEPNPGSHSLASDGDGSAFVAILTDRVRRGWDFTWNTRFHDGSGTVSVSSISATRISGTFSGLAVTASGSAEVLLIADGQFDVRF